MKTFLDDYRDKLVTPEAAAKAVKSGDFIYYSEFSLFPEAFDEALALRMDELFDLYLRSTSYTNLPKMVDAAPCLRKYSSATSTFLRSIRHMCPRRLSAKR